MKTRRLSALAGLLLLGAAGCSRPPDPKTPPHIVLIVADALRKDHLQVYGYPKDTTPFLSPRLRKGIIFDRFFANSCQTISSHFTLFSGELSRLAAPRLETSFVSDLKSLGYRTYGISANPMISSLLNFSLGFDVYNAEVGGSWQGRPEILEKKASFDRISGFSNPMSRYLEIHLTTTADIVNSQVFATLDDHLRDQREQPFFLFLNYLETHDPYFPYSPASPRINYNFRDEKNLPYDFLRRTAQLPEADMQALRTLYDDEIGYLDDHIGRLWTYLEDEGQLENTVFILTADHGELLGEHGLFTHDLGLYKEEVEVPFIVFGPGLKGRRLPGLHSLKETGEIVKSLAARKMKEMGSGSEARIVHRHYVLDAANKSTLPLFCRVDLLRMTFPRYSVFYYRHQDQDYFVAQDNDKADEWKEPISREDRSIIGSDVADFRGTLNHDRKLGSRLEEQLRSLGYLR